MRKLEVRVVTGSSKPRVEESPEGAYKVYVASSPEKGKANAEVIKLLAKHLGVARSRLSIVRGQKSRSKLIEVR